MDGPVLIGQGQTISQPFIVALMTDLAAARDVVVTAILVGLLLAFTVGHSVATIARRFKRIA